MEGRCTRRMLNVPAEIMSAVVDVLTGKQNELMPDLIDSREYIAQATVGSAAVITK